MGISQQPNSSTVATKPTTFELVFTLCERLGIASATGIGGVAMVAFASTTFPPLPVVSSALGVLVLVGAVILAFAAAAMFVTDVLGKNPCRIKLVALSVPIVIVTVCFALAVINGGRVALSH